MYGMAVPDESAHWPSMLIFKLNYAGHCIECKCLVTFIQGKQGMRRNSIPAKAVEMERSKTGFLFLICFKSKQI